MLCQVIHHPSFSPTKQFSVDLVPAPSMIFYSAQRTKVQIESSSGRIIQYNTNLLLLHRAHSAPENITRQQDRQLNADVSDYRRQASHSKENLRH